ncbi:MAG: nucleotidyltransferase domain-containing protein [Thermoplasmata archaeon]|jgi:predicted nucleotidyltransferase|nr:nucleotidyltransferase domain-containing protein [Thermoplasmata archaeon]
MIQLELIRALARRGRVEVIRALRSYPDKDFTINELARAAKVPVMTTWRAVKDLKKAGLLRTRKVGNATSVFLTDDREKLKTLKMIPETDPQRTAAGLFASRLAQQPWLTECRLFGSIGRGEHAPGEEVDVAVVYDDSLTAEAEAKAIASELAGQIKAETNVAVVPLCVATKDMNRKGGLAAELRDKEVIWSR